MAISIRNKHAENLAREVAMESGESLTMAIIHALEERLIRLRGRRAESDLVEEIMEIADRCVGIPDADPREPDEILGYGDNGVP